jgi:hypothetical protein
MASKSRRAQDRICNFFRSQGVYSDGGVGSPIKWKAPLISACKVCLVGQDRARMFGPATAGKSCGKRHFEMNEQSVRCIQKQVSSLRPFNGTPAKRHHELFIRGQADDCCMLSIAEGRLTLDSKQARNARSGLFFDHIIDVDESPSESLSHKGPYGGFSRAHKTGKNNPTGRDLRFCLRVNLVGQVGLPISISLE